MGTFRTGFSSIGEQGYETAIERGGAYGVDFVELTMNDYPGDELSSNADRIRSLADENDLDLVVHLPYGDRDAMIGSSDNQVRRQSLRRFESAVDAAGDIGAEKAVVHVDAVDELPLTEAGRFDDLCATVEELAAVAERETVELCLENMLGRQRRRMSPRDVYQLADRTGTSMTFDTGHARSMGYDDEAIASFLRAHGDIVSHFHLNDTRGTEDEHLPFGAGNVDFERIFSALPGDWEGTLTLEINTPAYGYVEVSCRKLTETLREIEDSRGAGSGS